MKHFPGMKFGLVPHFFDYDVAKKLPLNKFVTETDAPYFIPSQVIFEHNLLFNQLENSVALQSKLHKMLAAHV